MLSRNGTLRTEFLTKYTRQETDAANARHSGNIMGRVQLSIGSLIGLARNVSVSMKTCEVQKKRR